MLELINKLENELLIIKRYTDYVDIVSTHNKANILTEEEFNKHKTLEPVRRSIMRQLHNLFLKKYFTQEYLCDLKLDSFKNCIQLTKLIKDRIEHRQNRYNNTDVVITINDLLIIKLRFNDDLEHNFECISETLSDKANITIDLVHNLVNKRILLVDIDN